MFKVFAFVLVLVAVTYANQVGAPFEDDDNDDITTSALGKILTDAEIHLKVKSIESVRKQVVSGTKYIVEFISGDDHRCEATWVVQPWVSQKALDVHVSCK